jgi:hypothetical protein
MAATETKIGGMSSMQTSDFVYEAIKGAGKVGGYISNVLADTMYHAGKYVAYLRGVFSGCKDSLYEGRGEEGKITIVNLVRNDAAINEADRQEFYMNFGRDMVEVTKSGLESENLTIIDVSKYKM